VLTHPHQKPIGFGREDGIAAGVAAVMNGIRLIPSSGKLGLSELTPCTNRPFSQLFPKFVPSLSW
jgi:hypothetical protein